MKKIIIRKMSLVNFKGIRNLDIDFYLKEMSICGRNGAGKSSIFDAFTWLLFGKDSHDNKQFDIKTLDAEGKAIPQIPHEVSAVLDVDGNTIELCRRFTEKWTKKRGEAEATFTGHSEERLYNNVPCSVKEWNEKISNICPETMFKYITNPKYFTSQKSDVQRKMLFTMAGDVQDNEIASGNEDFEALLEQLDGKTFDEFKREINAKKKRIKTEIETIPGRIDERQREISDLSDVDYATIETELAAKQKELQEVDASISDKSKLREQQNKLREQMVVQMGNIKEERINLEATIKAQVMEEYHAAINKRNETQHAIEAKQRSCQQIAQRIDEYEAMIKDCKEEQDKLRKEYHETYSQVLEFNPNDFVCPTCKRPLEPQDIESKQQQMVANFNERKANTLKSINEKGTKLKDEITAHETAISDYKAEHDALLDDTFKLQALDIMQHEPEKPSEPEYAMNKEWVALDAKLTDISTELERQKDEVMNDDTLTERKQALATDIDALKQQLANKQVITRSEERIAELEKQLRDGSQEIAELERTEFVMQQFSKARIEAIDQRINGMFSLVKFKMFEQQINGGEVETCEATVNGVPYSSLNTAMQIWAGLDILTAISRFNGMSAPVFVDNAEALNAFPDVDAQLIKLCVSEDNTLTIK